MHPPNAMIPFPDALSIVDKHAERFEEEDVSVFAGEGRFLTQAVVSPQDMPPFSRSAMDGFAVAKSDLDSRGPGAEFKVVELVAAGQVASQPVAPGCAIQIMTGAPLPAGADWVVRVEYAEHKDGRVRFLEEEKSSNIVWAGENGRAGDVMVTPRRLAVHDVGTIASLGLGQVRVMKRPQLGIVSTGDEVKEPGEAIEEGEIYNSNGVQLVAHARRAGYEPRYYGIARDTEEDLRGHLENAFDENDVICLSGGVSKGEFDYVPRVLSSLGIETLFHRVALKPGRPTFFGRRETSGRPQYVFGLPGNPVSTFVTFELFAVRLLYGMAGIPPHQPECVARLGDTVRKSDPERTEIIPVSVNGDVARPVRYGGSSHLNALSQADALLQVNIGTAEIKGGTLVALRPL
jgi:molybdopterin molybdotransferase